jgi:hypothetical protein
VETSWSELSQAVEDLRDAVDSGETARVRESHTLLAHIYIAFAAKPDSGWLTLPEYIVTDGKEFVRGRVAVVDTSSFFDRIAVALKDLSRINDGSPTEVSKRDEAVAKGGLVLTDKPPSAYWAGQRLDVDWNRNRLLWRLVWQLAMKAKTGQAVGQQDLYEDTVSESCMARNVSRLKEFDLGTLKGLIIPGTEKATYRLNVETSRITLFGSSPSLTRRRVG